MAGFWFGSDVRRTAADALKKRFVFSNHAVRQLPLVCCNEAGFTGWPHKIFSFAHTECKLFSSFRDSYTFPKESTVMALGFSCSVL